MKIWKIKIIMVMVTVMMILLNNIEPEFNFGLIVLTSIFCCMKEQWIKNILRSEEEYKSTELRNP